MQPLQLEFEATVYWVDPLAARYVDDPSAMRRFRSLGQAVSFVLRNLPIELRPDARILTAAKTLMYDEVVALENTVSQKPQALLAGAPVLLNCFALGDVALVDRDPAIRSREDAHLDPDQRGPVVCIERQSHALVHRLPKLAEEGRDVGISVDLANILADDRCML